MTNYVSIDYQFKKILIIRRTNLKIIYLNEPEEKDEPIVKNIRSKITVIIQFILSNKKNKSIIEEYIHP